MEFSLVPLQIPPLSRPVSPGQGDEPAWESSQSPLSVGGCIYYCCYYYCRSAGAIPGIPVAVSALRAEEQKWRKSVGVGTRPLSAGRWCAASFPFLAPRRPWAPVSTAEALPPGLCGFCLLSQYPAPAPGSPSEETPWLEFPSE